MTYILIINYETDAERKRIDYAIERWEGRVRIWKPKGVVLMLEGSREDFNEFLEDMLSRLEFRPDDTIERKVRVLEASQIETKIDKKTKRLLYETTIDSETVKRFIDYLMAKLGAAYEFSDGIFKVYSAYTKKGQVRIGLRIDTAEITTLEIQIEGYGEVVEFISGRLKNEIESFLGGG